MKLLRILLPAILLGIFLSSPAKAAVYTCTSCPDCSNKIASASIGDTVQLTASISNQAGMCISFSGKSGIIFDCLGNTIDGDDISYGYGIWMREYNGEGSSYNTIRRCRITGFSMGVYISDYTSTNNIITDCTANSNTYDGFAIALSSNNVLTNLTATSNGLLGVALMGSNNVLANSNLNSNSQFGLLITDASYNAITNITASGNTIGIKFLCQIGLQYNTINSSRIENNLQYGAYFQSATGYNPRYNSFYNNYFNNTANLASDSVNNQPNYFNTAKTSGTNIAGGPWIAGNYWTSPGGNFSDTCTDSNSDGICDSAYTLSAGNVDSLPLKFFQQDTTPPVRSGGSPSGTLPAGTTQASLSLATNEPATCRYSASPGVSYSSMPSTFSSTGGTSHSSAVSGLQNGSNYNYYVKCQDQKGNYNPDDFQISFSIASPADYPPSITFVSPTPANNTNATGNYIEVKVSLSETPNACLLNWYSGTWANYTMAIQGLSCYRNMTNLPKYTYQFRVYANDSAGNMNVSETRQNGVSYSPPDTTPPVLVFVPPTPQNSTQTNQSWIFINASAGENLGSCILNWNGSNETFSPSGPSYTINKTSLSSGTYAFRMYASDSSGNWNSTETRYVTVNLSLPSVSDYISISYGISPMLVRTDTNTTVSVNVITNGTLDRIVVRITPPGSATAMFVFTGSTTFNYTPSLLGVYNLSVFANTTRGYSQSAGDNFTAVDCMGNETMECGIGVGECRKGNITCNNGAWGSTCEGAIGPQNETCNGKDDNCNGIIDDVKSGNSIQSTQCQCYNGGSPLASETCNGIDDNCNGLIDDNADCCTNGQTRSCGIEKGICEFGISACLGGIWGSCTGGVGPVSEVCGNSLDDNCNGQVDENCSVCADKDGDGYGDPASNACAHPQLDCNDSDRDVNPGMQEVCDNKDNNCNSQIDEGANCSTCSNGIMDGNEQGIDCGGDCAPCPDYSFLWISISVIGGIVLAILLVMYFKLKKQGKELTWEELKKKWIPA